MPPEDPMTAVFRALADPTRQRLLDRLHADNGQSLGALCAGLEMTRQGVTQHLAVLIGAGLVSAVKHGREKLHYLNPVPLQEIHERWIAKFEQDDLVALSRMKRHLEGITAMSKPKLVHVSYIAAGQDQIWQALTDPELTARYWGHRNVSGWRVGDSWVHQRPDGHNDGGGTILEIDPPRRLVHSWGANEDAEHPERHSRVTYELEPVGELVKVTVTHEDLAPEELDGTSDGWARVLSSLKSFLETGKPLSSLM